MRVVPRPALMVPSLPLLLVGCLPELQVTEDTGPAHGAYTCDQTVPERGDDIVDLDTQTSPFTYCGDLESTGNAQNSYTGDQDYTMFTPINGGYYELTLEWEEPDADYDLYLFLSEGRGEYTPIDASVSNYPESIEANLDSERDYITVVVGWSGPAGAWGVTVERL